MEALGPILRLRMVAHTAVAGVCRAILTVVAILGALAFSHATASTAPARTAGTSHATAPTATIVVTAPKQRHDGQPADARESE
jgi:hypothetical protein